MITCLGLWTILLWKSIQGCGQYYYGNGGSGTLLAFNYDQPNFNYYAKLLGNSTFSVLLNKVYVAARKHNTKRNKTGFILNACKLQLTSP